LSLTPYLGLKTMSGKGTECFSGSTLSNRKWRNKVDSNCFISNIAYFCPARKNIESVTFHSINSCTDRYSCVGLRWMECTRTDDVQHSSQVGNDQDQISQGQDIVQDYDACSLFVQQFSCQVGTCVHLKKHLFENNEIKRLDVNYKPNSKGSFSCLRINKTEGRSLRVSLMTLSRYFMLPRSVKLGSRSDPENICSNSSTQRV
jgi:hypothetical protein